MGNLGVVEISILAVVITFFIFGAIARKAGYSRWLSLLLLLPVLNIVMIWWFAYAKWPALGDDDR